MTEAKLRRRYVYMSDEEWAWLRDQSNWPAVTISSVVRSLVNDARKPLSVTVEPDAVTIDPPPAKGRDVLIAFRPAPKPTRRKR